MGFEPRTSQFASQGVAKQLSTNHWRKYIFERPIDKSSSNKVGKNLPQRGIEPGSAAWQSGMLTTRPLSFMTTLSKNTEFKGKFCQLSINYRISLSLHNARNLAYHEKKFHSSLWPAFLSPKKFFWHQIWVSRIFWQFFSPLNDFKKVSYFISSFAFGSTRKIILDFLKSFWGEKTARKP